MMNLPGPSSFYFGHLSLSKNSITLQRMQTSSILSRVVVVGLTNSRLPPFQDTPPITMTNLLQVVGFQHINMASLP